MSSTAAARKDAVPASRTATARSAKGRSMRDMTRGTAGPIAGMFWAPARSTWQVRAPDRPGATPTDPEEPDDVAVSARIPGRCADDREPLHPAGAPLRVRTQRPAVRPLDRAAAG